MPNNKPQQGDEELRQKIEDITQTMLIALSEWQAGSVVNYTSIKEEGRQELFRLIKAYSLQEAIRELSGVFGLMEDDVTLWTQLDGDPFRLSERIAHLKKELEALK